MAEELGTTGAQCIKRFHIIRPKTSMFKVTTEEKEDPKCGMSKAEKKVEKAAKRAREDAQQKLTSQAQSGVNTGWSMPTFQPSSTTDDDALYAGVGWIAEDEDIEPTQTTSKGR
jgi:hypothetical protein